MTTTTKTEWRDWDRNGAFDETTTTQFNFTADKLTHKVVWIDREAPGTSTAFLTTYGYDEAGRIVTEHEYADQNRDGTWETDFGTLNRTFDAAGRVSSETHLSPDFDGDGVPGDYTTVTTYAYNAAGQIVAKNSDSYSYGEQAPADYRDETWTYDSSGRQASYVVDDPMAFDCVITRTNSYNAKGQLQNIKETNEIRFGDERPRIDESFTYNKDGSPKTHTSWADFSDKGWFQRVDDNYNSWDGKGYDGNRTTYDLQGDWKFEAVKLTENWHDANGNLTHTLISYDDQGDGGPLPGGGAPSGYDYRDLMVKTWENGVMVAETHDLGLDGIIDYQMSLHTDALIA